MTGKNFILALLCCFVFLACQKTGDHAGHDHSHDHAGHDHGHDHGKHDHGKAGHEHKAPAAKPAAAVASVAQTVEAGCAMCIYKMEGINKCTLAVKLDGKPHLVEGAQIHDLGDAHAADGLCKTARQATVEGKLEGDKFVASKIALKPQAK